MNARMILLALASVLVLAVPAFADDVGITSARLVELPDGRYAIEADVPPQLLPAFRPPVLPEGFRAVGDPQYVRAGVVLVVRYEFEGDRPLGPGDVILLPWGRSAVLLTARWQDGSMQRVMFPRGAAGISVAIDVLRPVELPPLALVREQAIGALVDPPSWFLRALLWLALAAAARGIGTAARLGIGVASGHALAMVAFDVGLTLHAAASPLALGLGAVLFARTALRADERSLAPLAVAIGLADGLGLAAEAASLPAWFGTVVALDVVSLALAIAAAAVLRVRSVAAVLGALAVAGTIDAFVEGAAGAQDVVADRLLAERVAIRDGGDGDRGSQPAPSAPRQLEHAAMLFVNVEPREVRVEMIVGVRAFATPLRIDTASGDVVPVALQAEIVERARELVADALEVAIDGRDARSLLERVEFVTVEPTGVETRTSPEPEPLDTAALGVTLVFGVERKPASITASWSEFPGTDTEIPAIAIDPVRTERTMLTRERPELTWTNDLSGDAAPEVRAVDVRLPEWPLVSVVLLLAAAVLRFGPVATRWFAPLALGSAVALYPFVRTPLDLPLLVPSRAETAAALDDLLTNVYRSFGLREEGAIYDCLAISVTGEQLTEIYLENHRALELENRGGARARVDEVEVLDVASIVREGDGYRVEASWSVAGSVNHFGHVHYRRNRYLAAVEIVAVDGAWRIRRLDVLDERREI